MGAQRTLKRWLILAAMLGTSAAVAQPSFFTIGTGGVTGVYYSVGGAICDLVNRQRRSHGLRCSVEATAGSAYNVTEVRRGGLELGLAQSDVQYAAYNGYETFRGAGPDRKLRSLFSLHYELVTLVVHPDSGIARLDDLRGKRVSLGVRGGGTRFSAERLMATLELQEADFAELAQLKPDEQVQALCQKRVDAFLYVVGHPSVNIAEAATLCGARMLPLMGLKVDRLVRNNPYYVIGAIPGGLYAANAEPVPSYGFRATLVASADTPEKVAYEVVRAVFENFPEFLAPNPALSGLDPKTMLRDGLTAPLHPGAIRYYREKGWL